MGSSVSEGPDGRLGFHAPAHHRIVHHLHLDLGQDLGLFAEDLKSHGKDEHESHYIRYYKLLVVVLLQEVNQSTFLPKEPTMMKRA